MLDMDGTLLDLAFDNYMWEELVPRRYAEKNGMSFEESRDYMLGRYAAIQGDLEWYCLDHWQEQLGLDVLQLHHDISHRIGYLSRGLANTLMAFIAHTVSVSRRRARTSGPRCRMKWVLIVTQLCLSMTASQCSEVLTNMASACSLRCRGLIRLRHYAATWSSAVLKKSRICCHR